jgi:excinuclease ABC subunit C
MAFDPKELTSYPTDPGIYLMRDQGGAVLYVGKAINIRSRLKQYFQKGGDGREMIPFLIAKVEVIETIVTNSEKEALVLENNLIKQHRPRYNVLYRDDKSYLCLAINQNHPWPTVKIRRSHKRKQKAGELLFGPYPNPYSARAALSEIYRYFQLRQCSDRELESRKRPCILHGMGRCPAPCTHEISSEAYQKKVKRAIAFLRGERAELITELKAHMNLASERLEFEKAALYLSQIKGLERVRSSSTIVENARLGDCDVIGSFRAGPALGITTLIIREGRLIGSEEQIFEEIASGDDSALELFLMQRLVSAFDTPTEIVVRALESSPDVLEAWAKESLGQPVKVTIPKKGLKYKMLELAETNAKANFEKSIEESRQAEMTELALSQALDIDPPGLIECIDQSHLSGEGMVSAIVTFRSGKKETKGYRRYSMREAIPGDDVGALKEALRRHYHNLSPSSFPDLLLVDGARAQVNAAASILSELGITTIEVIGIAKDKSRHDKGINRELIYKPDSSAPIDLGPTSQALFFLQRIRDEAHRFVITYQKKKRSKALIKSSLDGIDGIGPKKKAALLRRFGSIKTMREASVEEIAQVKGVSQTDAEKIADFLGNS